MLDAIRVKLVPGKNEKYALHPHGFARLEAADRGEVAPVEVAVRRGVKLEARIVGPGRDARLRLRGLLPRCLRAAQSLPAPGSRLPRRPLLHQRGRSRPFLSRDVHRGNARPRRLRHAQGRPGPEGAPGGQAPAPGPGPRQARGAGGPAGDCGAGLRPDGGHEQGGPVQELPGALARTPRSTPTCCRGRPGACSRRSSTSGASSP